MAASALFNVDMMAFRNPKASVKQARAASLAACLSGFVLLTLAGGAQARSANEQMLLLAPSERVEQRCNARAMGEVGRHTKGMKPDELVAYAYRDPVIKGGAIKAPGAAIRSGGTWYHLAYECETTNDGLDVARFSYTLGASIPTVEWASHYLVAP